VVDRRASAENESNSDVAMSISKRLLVPKMARLQKES